MNSEIISKIIIGSAFGIGIAIFLTPIYVYLKKIFYNPTQNKKLLDKAIKQGHIVNAKLIKTNDILKDNGFGFVATGEEIATYEYSYNGKTYKRKFMGFNKFGSEVELYFISNPRKVEFGDNLWTTIKNHWIISYLFIVLIIWIISSIILIYK